MLLNTPKGLYIDNLEYNRNAMEVLFEGVVSVLMWNSEGVQLIVDFLSLNPLRGSYLDGVLQPHTTLPLFGVIVI